MAPDSAQAISPAAQVSGKKTSRCGLEGEKDVSTSHLAQEIGRTQARFSRAAGLAKAAVAKTARKMSLSCIVNEVVGCEVSK